MEALERIAFDARYINDRYHGIGRYAFRLLEALVEAAPQYTFLVFRGRIQDTRFDWEALAARANVELWDGPWPLYGPQEQLHWPGLLRRSRADLYYSPYFVAPLLARCPAVVTVHDLIFDRYPRYMPHAWSWPYYKLLMALSVRRARRVVAVSGTTRADLLRYYRPPADKVVVAPEGAEAAFAPVSDRARLRQLRERYGLTRPVILSVGARRPHKNQARLVRAFAAVAPRLDHSLVLVGSPDERFPDEARAAVARLANGHGSGNGLRDRVHLIDWVPEDDLAGLYSLAEVVVVPSLVEGFGLPALEAMANGTPVLAADATSLPEVVGDAGVLFDPYDEAALAEALHGLLADRRLQEQLAAAGQARAATFTWTGAARQLLGILDGAHA